MDIFTIFYPFKVEYICYSDRYKLIYLKLLSWRLQVFTLPGLVTCLKSRDRFKCLRDRLNRWPISFIPPSVCPVLGIMWKLLLKHCRSLWVCQPHDYLWYIKRIFCQQVKIEFRTLTCVEGWKIIKTIYNLFISKVKSIYLIDVIVEVWNDLVPQNRRFGMKIWVFPIFY